MRGEPIFQKSFQRRDQNLLAGLFTRDIAKCSKYPRVDRVFGLLNHSDGTASIEEPNVSHSFHGISQDGSRLVIGGYDVSRTRSIASYQLIDAVQRDSRRDFEEHGLARVHADVGRKSLNCC